MGCKVARKIDKWPLAIRMLVYDIHELKPNAMLFYIKNARTPSDWLQGTKVGTRWSRLLFGWDVPEEARMPDEAVPWVTLWEAMQAGSTTGRFTTLQCQSLCQTVRSLESEEERKRWLREPRSVLQFPETEEERERWLREPEPDCYAVD